MTVSAGGGGGGGAIQHCVQRDCSSTCPQLHPHFFSTCESRSSSTRILLHSLIFAILATCPDFFQLLQQSNVNASFGRSSTAHSCNQISASGVRTPIQIKTHQSAAANAAWPAAPCCRKRSRAVSEAVAARLRIRDVSYRCLASLRAVNLVLSQIRSDMQRLASILRVRPPS